MNRQIVPSMLLSVLIVCFFAVILFERDSPRRPGANERALTRKKIGVEHLSSAPQGTVATPTAPPPADAKPKAEEETKPEARAQASGALSSVSGSPPSAHAPSATPAPDSRTPLPDAPTSKPPAVTQPSATQTARPSPPPAREGATRSVDSGLAERPPVKKAPAEPVAESGRQQAFTAVRQGETLRDVAIRVYGSADELDSLWRANRDVLPRQDTPLAAGSVLRTPANTLGQ